MSSLIFYTDETQALVATDTLAVSNDVERTPFNFTTKAFIVPHLRLIMAGTGLGGFLEQWFVQVNGTMRVRGIDNLDYHTPAMLTNLWGEFAGNSKKLSVSVYHFGFSEEDNLIHAYAYTSANGFRSEPLTYGIKGKPEFKNEDYNFPVDLKKMMDGQREIQAALPRDGRVYIGGRIQVHHLNKDGFSVYTLDQFDDYEATQQAIFG